LYSIIKEYPKALKELSKWVQKGKIKFNDHIIEGLENAPESLNILFSGDKVGKLIIKISQEPIIPPSPKL